MAEPLLSGVLASCNEAVSGQGPWCLVACTGAVAQFEKLMATHGGLRERARWVTLLSRIQVHALLPQQQSAKLQQQEQHKALKQQHKLQKQQLKRQAMLQLQRGALPQGAEHSTGASDSPVSGVENTVVGGVQTEHQRERSAPCTVFEIQTCSLVGMMDPMTCLKQQQQQPEMQACPSTLLAYSVPEQAPIAQSHTNLAGRTPAVSTETPHLVKDSNHLVTSIISERVASLEHIGAHQKCVLGLGDRLVALTVTADGNAVRSAQKQGITLEVLLHRPVWLTGR